MKIINKRYKRGFTLIELLAVIVILGIVVSVVLVVFVGSKDKATDKITFITEENILKSSSYYTDEYNSNLVWSNNDNKEMACIPVRELVNKGYFKEPEVKKSGYFDSSVLVTKSNEKVNDYKFSNDNNCGIVDTGVSMTLNGNNPLTVEYGTDYGLWKDITVNYNNSMEKDRSITIDGMDCNNSDCSNTKSLSVGEYVAHYSVTTYGEASATLDRNIKIIDSVAPTIEFTTPIVKGVGEDFSLTDNVVYKDNALYKDGEAIDDSSKRITLNDVDISNTKDLKVGNYNIRYVVKDRSGNETVKYRDVNIITNKWDFSYVGYEEEFVAPEDGYYYIDGKGAQSNYIADKLGGEVTGYIYLNKGEKVIVNVGGSNGYNGGGITKEDSFTYSGGGATTLRKGTKNLITAAGGGRSGIFCNMTYTSSAPSSNTEFWSYSGSSATCVVVPNDKATGGSGDGSGGSNLGYGAGGNGTNGGGGASSLAKTNVSNICTNTVTETTYTEIQGSCLVQDTTCIKINGSNFCYPSGCKKYDIIKVPNISTKCVEYTVIRQRTDDAGSGGSNSVDVSVKNYNLINGGGSLGDGHLSIKFVGDSYE